jgi:hypothetical protein
MKALSIVTAVLEVGAGLALLGFPSAVAMLLLGTPLETSTALTVARVAGAGLLALGVACWFARSDMQSHAALGLVAAMLIYNAAAVAVLAYAGTWLGLHGALLWPAVFLHAAMALWCAAYLLRRPTN